MSYVDGFVVAVPTANREAYRAMAEHAAAIFKRHGALAVVEAWGDDVPEGKVTSFPLALDAGADETVVFSWILWPSREARDEGLRRSMADPEMDITRENMPFDGKRLIFGGFETLVEL